MVNIIFRHYQPGDEQELASLFNLAFKRTIIKRTPTNWIWRYVDSPGFENEMCQMAEDLERKKIVGAVLVNLIETIPINQKKFLIGEINDVSTHPDYTRKGIARKLMKNSIEYMKQKNCDFSILCTGLKGFARSRLYQKLGYKDLEKQYYFIQIPYIPHFIKSFFGFSLFFPVFLLISLFPRFLNRLRIKFMNSFSEFSYDIHNNEQHYKYMNAANRISPKNYEGYPKYDKSKFNWLRIDTPTVQQKPTYIFMKKKERIIGGAIITHQNLNLSKFKIKIRFGIIHEIFLDRAELINSNMLINGYIYLIDKILKAATRRKLGILLYGSSIKNFFLNQAFSKMHFIKILNDVIMVKELKENLKFPKFKKPLYVPTYISLGF